MCFSENLSCLPSNSFIHSLFSIVIIRHISVDIASTSDKRPSYRGSNCGSDNVYWFYVVHSVCIVDNQFTNQLLCCITTQSRYMFQSTKESSRNTNHTILRYLWFVLRWYCVPRLHFTYQQELSALQCLLPLHYAEHVDSVYRIDCVLCSALWFMFTDDSPFVDWNMYYGITQTLKKKLSVFCFTCKNGAFVLSKAFGLTACPTSLVTMNIAIFFSPQRR
jgi:hypothetical protein